MKKLKLILPIVLVLAGGGFGAYKFLLAPKPAKAAKAPKPKVEGVLLALAPEFVVNLSDGHFGKVSVTLLLKEQPALPAEPAEGPPKLEQDAVIRSTITDQLTGLPPSDLIDRDARHELLDEILKDLEQTTDIEVTRVLFTDVVVQ